MRVRARHAEAGVRESRNWTGEQAAPTSGQRTVFWLTGMEALAVRVLRLDELLVEKIEHGSP
jgi:hypothetical protein